MYQIFLSILFFLLSLALFNTYPYLDFVPSSISELIFSLFITAIALILYMTLKYIYISSLTYSSGSSIKGFRNILRLIYVVTRRLNVLILLIALYVLINSILILIITIKFEEFITGNRFFIIIYSWIIFLFSIILEHIIAPYIMIRRTYYMKNTIFHTLLLYTLPWLLIQFLVSIIINTLIVTFFGLQYIYPYYRGWNTDALNILRNIGPRSIPIPSYGQLISIIIISYYTGYVTRRYYGEPLIRLL